MPADRLWHTQVFYHKLFLAMQTAEDVMQEPLQALLDGKVQTVEYAGGRVVVDAPRRRRVYLPGSFNPLHDGHRCRPSCMTAIPLAGELRLELVSSHRTLARECTQACERAE